ncbi:hypothetical protein FOH24_05580 [Acetobacter tropicalis]|uniref:hypothetical protein n=1 Tax=Acetobacter tropicalis TaxID=104102 RepID=UPI00123BEA1E|nr:hypothetical protein [Acetobacter tropicalis]KAA8389044.1 hypothetical protein FOH22_07280 [Acetobacter tropicalis]KAA8391774.1 hypothetical protein FOH24_05580 [Acetobacter tropicalis]MBC9009110.1 hypothetical protein [Acetobacter tropicalis]MDO8171288.1 hypothetical protein [Acetobacter tropicalis]
MISFPRFFGCYRQKRNKITLMHVLIAWQKWCILLCFWRAEKEKSELQNKKLAENGHFSLLLVTPF